MTVRENDFEMSDYLPKKGTQGFASMDAELQREIASKGGKKAHEYGSAHEWDADEARDAGRKGGLASAEAKRRRKLADASPAPSLL